MDVTETHVPSPEGPWQLLTTNGRFVRLWTAQLVSFAGDWINSVALVGLLLELTGSGFMVSLLIVSNTLPFFILMPIAGVVADRFDRRRIMLCTNLVQALLALGFLYVHQASQVWIIYVLSVAMVSCEAFFSPASSAAIPNVVTECQLTAANTLAGSSWGTMVAVGSAVGGLVAHHYGRNWAFVLNALSFVVSALLIASVRGPFAGRRFTHEVHSPFEDGPRDTDIRDEEAALASGPIDVAVGALRHAARDFKEAVRYARHHTNVLALLLIKTSWGVGGGVVALLSVIPVTIMHTGDDGIGILYASRGLGALLGPLIAHAFVRDRPRVMAVVAALGICVSGLFYGFFSLSTSMLIATPLVFAANLGGGTQWSLSTSLLQRTVADRMMGRIASLDLAGITLTMTISNLICGWGIQATQVGPRACGVAAGTILVTLGLTWTAWFTIARPLDFGHRDTNS